MRSCRGVKVAAVIVGALSLAPMAGAAFAHTPAVTIRLYDYAVMPPDRLDRAQVDVARLYAQMGVDLTWETTCRGALAAPSARACESLSDLTLIVLSPDMARRTGLPDDVLGAAPGTITERGRIAYVLYDRLQSIAVTLARDVMDIMVLVMAHEIGHLLLPYGSHTEVGVMRARWSLHELQRMKLTDFRFTVQQGQVMRRVLSERAPAGPLISRAIRVGGG